MGGIFRDALNTNSKNVDIYRRLSMFAYIFPKHKGKISNCFNEL